MEEEYNNIVKLYSYFVNEKLLIEIDKQGKPLNDEIECDVQKILKDNNIWYKNKLVDYWHGIDYKIMVEIYVAEVDLNRAKELIEELDEGEFIDEE